MTEANWFLHHEQRAKRIKVHNSIHEIQREFGLIFRPAFWLGLTVGFLWVPVFSAITKWMGL